ncbi:hypothetical protein PG984_006848 [Apiospora sp. TS-2023a]
MDSIPQALHLAAHADLSTTLITAAVVGLLAHIPIYSFEFERIALQFMIGCVACFFGLGGLYVYTGQCSSPFVALARSFLVQAVFHMCLLASIAVYRLGFHRCHHIPGPVCAKLSRFYAMYLTSKNIQFQNELLQMHEKYGDFVRTGPREVSVLRKAAVNAIFGPHSKCSKSIWYAQNGYDSNETTLQMCRDRVLYRRRRRAWDKGLSIKALATYVPRIKSHADLLVQRLRERAERPVDVTQWSMFFAFDMIGDVGYGKSFDQLVTLQEHPAIKPIHEHLMLFAVLQNAPWFLYLLDCIPGTAAIFAVTAKFFEDQRPMAEKDGTGPPSTKALDEDTKLLLVAGRSLTNALFFLSRYPEKQKKLRAALLRKCSGDGTTSAAADWSYDAVLGVKYLDHFIHETLRLKPSAMISGRMETPQGGLQVDEVHIPGAVVVTAPIIWLQRDPRYWQRADEFLPERWGNDCRAEMGTDGSPYFPFSLGAFSCPGKNLGLMVLRIALSSIVQNFEVGFAPGETGVEFDNEAKDTFTTMLPPLNLQFTQLDNA